MAYEEIKNTVLVDLITGTFFFVLGLLWPKIRLLNKPIVRWFFGKGIFDDRCNIVHGSIVDSRAGTAQPGDVRFIKQFHDGRRVGITGPWGNCVGDSELRAVSYIISALDMYRDNPIKVLDDRTAFQNLESTFIALGSPSSNEISDLAMREPSNEFLEFGQDNDGVFIRDKKSGQLFRGFEHREHKDLGIVLKIPNNRFPGYYFIICAGLGDWGTSGSSWFLATYWRRLPWSRRGFGIIVEVESNSDTSARKLHEVT